LQKDRVSVLTHTIDYIHQLKTQVTQLEKAAGPLLKQEKGIDYSQPPVSTMSQEFSTLSSSSRSPIKVAVSPNEDGLVINVEASNHTETLVHILSVSRDLGLEIRSFNSKSINDQVQVAVNVVVCALSLSLALLFTIKIYYLESFQLGTCFSWSLIAAQPLLQILFKTLL
jgi:acetolactate synthase regulatory subunit